MRDLSVIITARNEEFLARTTEDILSKKSINTEVIVVADGNWPNPSLKDHPDLTIIYHPEARGQRQSINEAVRVSRAKYIMKIDAHCIVGPRFDEILVKSGDQLGEDVTQVPRMFNLHVFNWKCNKCGNEWYQSPTPTDCQNPGEAKGRNESCDSKDFEKKIIWQPRWSRKNDHYSFDQNMKFRYWGALGNRKESRGDFTETVSLQGSCFFMSRKRYWDLGGSDEEHGSWGQQGTEIACKSWYSGGRVITNRKTWYSHMFRTQGGDFGFPYPLSGSQVQQARDHSNKMFKEGKWLFKGKKPPRGLQWLLNRLKPVPDWHDEEKSDLRGESGIIFYTDNGVEMKIAHRVQKQLLKASDRRPIVSISLKPMGFPGNRGENVHIPEKRGWITMNKQILAGLKKLKTRNVFFCEHDVLYHPSHFDFEPLEPNVYYYNLNVWKLRQDDGLAVKVDFCQQLSGLVCNREFAIKHYEKRLKMLEDGVKVRRIGFEPGTHTRKERVDEFKAESYSSKLPNVDIRRGECATASRWKPEDFRNKKFTIGWKETKDIPGWGKMEDFL